MELDPETTYSVAGVAAAGTTAVCWTFSALLFESASRRVGSLPVNLLRLLMAMLLFAAYGLVMHGAPLPRGVPAANWAWLAASGFIGFFLGDLFLFRAFVLVGSRIAMLVMTLAPPLAALTAWAMLGERLTAWGWLGMGTTLAGVAWVVLERTRDAGGIERRLSPIGLGMALLASGGQGVGLAFGKIGMRVPSAAGGFTQMDPFAATEIRAIAGALAFAATVLVLRRGRGLPIALRDQRAMVLTTLGAIVGPFLGVSLLLLAVQQVPVGVAQTVAATVPILILPLAVLVHHHRISPRAAVGAVLAVAGVALLVLSAPSE